MKPSRIFGLFTAFTAALTLTSAAAPLPRSTPEAEGISSQAVLDFVEAADTHIDTMHSFMILRHGKVVAEGWWSPEAAEKPHVLWSVSKSFTSTAIGMAIAEGKLGLDDPVLKFFSDEVPADPSKNLQAMTVRDLLTMTSGHDTEPRIKDWKMSVEQFFAHPVVHEPGTHFVYNSMGSYVLSAILTKTTGETVLDYLQPRLFGPLGIDDVKFESSDEGYSLGGYGLYLRTEDIAKLGQLYLQKGRWEGKQLIDPDWVTQATSKQVPNAKSGHAGIGSDWEQGYGYQFWQCRHGAYRADGLGGQFIVVIPEKETVIAITADHANMQDQLDTIWTHLLPALGDRPLPENAEALEKLRAATARLKVDEAEAP